jgi:hypothetical protein
MSSISDRYPPGSKSELNPVPLELDLYAHVEGLVGEEAALLKIPAAERSREQHERLHALGAELDRLWEKLRERGERLGRGDRPAPEAGR